MLNFCCRLLVLATFSVTLLGCGATSSDNPPSHERMLQLLQQIKNRMPLEEGNMGSAELVEAESALAQLPANAPAAERCVLHAAVALHTLKLGQTQKSIEHHELVHELLPQLTNQFSKEDIETTMLLIAVSYLRLGETENCVNCRTGESCLLPIRGSGVHSRQEGSRKAIQILMELLQRNPNELKARWLLNIAYMTIGGYPDDVPKEFLIPPEAFESEEPFPRFPNVAAELGLDVFKRSGGCIVDDFNGDGWLDVVASGSAAVDQLRYFESTRDSQFSEKTEEARLTGLLGGLNLVQADYDNDGDVDILVLRGGWRRRFPHHPNSLLRNDGQGRFWDVTFDVGLGNQHFPTQTAAWADFDNDGDLDLYIGNEQFPNQLFENVGGRFTDIAKRAGVDNVSRFTKGVVWGDYNNDRYPDIYVSNLEASNRLYRNNRDGTFTDVAPELDVVRPYSSFPCWFWDFNNDGILDIYVDSCLWNVRDVAADYLGLPHDAERDCLYQGDGHGGFREVAAEKNLTRVTHSMGCNFGDLDNDGFPDFYLGTGYPGYDGLMPNLMFHNHGGKRFTDVTFAGGFGHLQKGHGISFADFDHDGDQDVYAVLGGAFLGDGFNNALFRNPGFGNHWITIKLIGRDSNRSAIGARIRIDIVESGIARSIYKWVNSGGSFGAKPLRQEIGVGKANRIKSLEVYWPKSDQVQQFHDVEVDQFIEITEGAQKYRRLPELVLKKR